MPTPLLTALVTAAVLAGDADPVPRLRAVRLEESDRIDVDGLLDEAVWQSAPAATSLRQREPLEGLPASESTEVRVLYDEAALYVGILARDREPEHVIGRILERDRVMREGGFGFGFAGDDAVAILLDPFHDRRNAMVFATNPNGAEFDASITDESARFNVDWRALWSVRARRIPEGWSAEMRIPFRTLRYPQSDSGEPWGFNVYRMIRRRNEEVLWSAWSREGGGFHRVSQAGELHGLVGLPPRGLNLEVKPWGLAGAFRERDEDTAPLTHEEKLDAGFDVKWELGPGLVLDGTLNPDFAQVEVDAQQVNLTRFDLFFPEKREFFLENAGLFDFGTRGFFEPPPILLFFSRRIGISDDGEIPVRGGVRLSGRAGRQTIGFLDAVTGPAFGEPVENFLVARVKRDVGRSGFLGAMLTDRRSADAANTAGGFDVSLWPGARLNLQGFWARSATSGEGGDDDAFRLAAVWSGDRFGLDAEFLSIGPEVVADAGFVTREDIRRVNAFARVTLRPERLGLRKVDLFPGILYVENHAGEKQDLNVNPFVVFEWESGEEAGLFYGQGYENVTEEFDLADRLPVPAGLYDLRQVGFFGGTSSRRALRAGFSATHTRLYGGTLLNLGVGAGARLGSHLSFDLAYIRDRVELPTGSFTAHLPSLRLTLALSTRLTLSAYLQYNSLENEFLANVRFNFIHRPGSDLFVVFNEARGSADFPDRLQSRGFVVKLTWLVRL